MQDLMLLNIIYLILGGLFFTPPIEASLGDPSSDDDAAYSAAKRLLPSSPSSHPSPSALDENVPFLVFPPAFLPQAEQATNNVLQPQRKEDSHKRKPDSSLLNTQTPLVRYWELSFIDRMLMRVSPPPSIKTPVYRQQSQKRIKRDSQDSSIAQATEDIKQSVKNILCTRIIIDGEERFYTMKEIANILNKEAILLNKPYRPPPSENICKIILNDPELRKLYEKRKEINKNVKRRKL